MTNASLLPRKLLIFGLVLPVAALVGYLLSNPDFESLLMVGVLLSVLCIPGFLRWHHMLVILCWNLSMTLFFLPGNPPMWTAVSLGSLALTLVGRVLNKESRLISISSVNWPLIMLGLVVLFTMKMAGGFGLRSLGGGSYGGKKYFFILFSIAAYFALSMRRSSLRDGKSVAACFFLPGLSSVVSNLIYLAGPSLWILYALFPADLAIAQAAEDFMGSGGQTRLGRMPGIGPAGIALFCFMLSRYGLRGVLDWEKPWRMAAFLVVVLSSLFGGSRSVIVLFAVTCVFQFCFEGLHRTRLLPVMLVSLTLIGMGLIPVADRLPLSVQRCLTILPYHLNPMARLDAQASTDWRLRMWEVVWPEIPKYLVIGKGCGASATDYYLAQESIKRGLSQDYELSLLAGDYHNGLLSILIPFGAFALIAFLWFCVASFRALLYNFRYGDPALSPVNGFLLSFFAAKVIFFFAVFGSLFSDLVGFVGLVGLSASLNGGLCRKPALAPERKSPAPVRPVALRPFRA